LRLVGGSGEGPNIDSITGGPPAERVAAAIRAGICPNERSFDRFLPYELRLVSHQHWTPLVVALRAAEWLDAAGAKTVVDIGSGAGKFCVAAALRGRCAFTGIEQRPRLVQAAGALARLFGVHDRVRFVQGSVSECPLPEADAYYLYNPFGENLFGSDEHLDEDVELSVARYRRDVALVEAFFANARLGTYVIKYNGFGGRMPSGYQRVRVDRETPSVLRMWRKVRATASTASQGAASAPRNSRAP
jgi:predicted RNA methylase